MYKCILTKIRQYIFLILTATIFFTATFSKSLSEENVFIIDNVKIEKSLGLDFDRNKFINEAFLLSFKKLMSKILLSSDFNRIKEVKLKNISKYALPKANHKIFKLLNNKYQN